MANIQRGQGENVQIVAPSALTSGTPILVNGNLFGVPLATAASGAAAVLQTKGTFALPKTAGASAYALGAKVFWNQSTSKATATATDVQVGTCAIAAGIDDTSVVTLIDGFIKEPVDADAVAALLPENGLVGRTSSTALTAALYGSLVMASGGSTGTATITTGYAGKNVLVSVMSAASLHATFIPIFTGAVSGTTLTITARGKDMVAANVTADVTIAFLVLP